MYSIKDGIALAPQQNRPSSTASANKSYSSQHTIIKNRCKTYTHTHTYALIVNILWSKDQVSRDSGTAGSSHLWTEHENSIPLQGKKKKKNCMVKRPSVNNVWKFRYSRNCHTFEWSVKIPSLYSICKKKTKKQQKKTKQTKK